MNIWHFEIYKIVHRKSSLALLLITICFFPALVIVIAYFNVVQDGVTEGLFINNVAFGIIAFAQNYFFLPVWIIVFAGLELSNGHVNRVAFYKSKKYYFLSKICYCILVTLFFSFLGLLTLLVVVKTSSFTNLYLDPIFCLKFFTQLIFATFSYSIVLLCMVLLFQSPIKTFVIYFGWIFIEGIIFLIIKGFYNIELIWLPFHFVRTFFTRNGELALENYYNPFSENIYVLIFPIGFILLLISISLNHFSKSDLKPLSD